MIKKSAIILHDIRSIHNVGSIFRTAECAGISKVFLTGYTPAPIDRFGRPVKEFAKTALGAEKNIVWEKIELEDCVKKLREQSFEIIAVEQNEKSKDYKNVKPNFPCAFIFGNEVDGLSKNILKMCDIIAEIPIMGKKESLNVSVAFGVAIFRMLQI